MLFSIVKYKIEEPGMKDQPAKNVKQLIMVLSVIKYKIEEPMLLTIGINT